MAFFIGKIFIALGIFGAGCVLVAFLLGGDDE